MSVAMKRTAVVLLASGLSRRYGRKDKMLAELGGKLLVEYAGDVVAKLNTLTRIAVCSAEPKDVSENLNKHFVVAINKAPKAGLGHSIAVGAKVAMQFKPDAMLFVMADMPFIEAAMLRELVSRLGGRDGADIVHSGGADGVRSPTAFGAACFAALTKLDGDDGAKSIVKSGAFRVAGIGAAAPLLVDVDTRHDLKAAEEQLAIRKRHRATTKPRPVKAKPKRRLPRSRFAATLRAAQR